MATEAAVELKDLRDRMVRGLMDKGAITSPAVEAAFAAVPRHRFAPEVPPEQVYNAPEALFTKHADNGRAVSSVSAPWLHARMLETAQLAPGMRVLEIGSGGCNAALLAEIVGPTGAVTSLDIDPDITARARELLDETGYKGVRIETADGALPLADAPAEGWDRIVVTTGSADLPEAWFDQLAADGRLVVPLRFRGLSRTLAFARNDGHLRSDTSIVSGFLAMQGESAHAPTTVRLADDDVRLIVDEKQPYGETALREAFTTPAHETWTGVLLTGSEGLLPRLDVWLAGAVAPYGRLRATQAATDRGLVGWVLKTGAATVWDDNSLAYLTMRQAPGHADHFELGAISHGPDRQRLGGTLAEAVTTWNRTARSAGEPVLRAYRRSGTDHPSGVVIEKPSARLTVN